MVPFLFDYLWFLCYFWLKGKCRYNTVANKPTNKNNMISQEEIKSFLEGNDPEEHIVAIEFDYATDSI